MWSNFLFFNLCVATVLHCKLFGEAFRMPPMKKLSGYPSCNIVGKNHRQCRKVLFQIENEGKETEKLDPDEDEEDEEDLPMFTLEYNPENVEMPIPPFTAAIVFIVSTAFTGYLYYVGLTAGVAPPPGP